MPAASEINACCPTSLTLLKQPEDSADGFNGLLLFMFITAQICHVNTNFLNSDSAVIQLPPSKHVQYFVCLRLFWKWSEKRPAGGDFNRLLLILVRSNLSRCRADRHTNTQCILCGLLFPVLMSPGSVSLVQERQRTLVWVKGQPSLIFWLASKVSHIGRGPGTFDTLHLFQMCRRNRRKEDRCYHWVLTIFFSLSCIFSPADWKWGVHPNIA